MEGAARLAKSLASVPVLGILRGCPADRVVDLVTAAVGSGLTAVEVTMDSEDAAGQIRSLAGMLPEEVALGAGTVTTMGQVDVAAEAGAAFVVSPALDPDVVAYARSLQLAAIPGVLSPTEIAGAVAAGASMCKLFPAGPLGASYLKALRGPYPAVPFLCTGGIGASSVASFLAAGAFAVGIGRDIFVPEAIERGDLSAVASATATLLEALPPAGGS